jgi:CBS domain-containing protein
MKVLDLMATSVISVTPETTFKETLNRLLDNGISSVPVVDADGALLGIVTEADLVSKEAYGGRRRRPLQLLADLMHEGRTHGVAKAEGLTAGAVMTAAVTTAAPSEDVRVAARRMVEKGLKRLPVVLDGNVVGMLSRRDVLWLFHRADAEIQKGVEAHLASMLWAPEDTEVTVDVKEGVVDATGSVRHPMDVRVVEAAIWAVPGVVGVRSDLTAREPDPHLVGR